MPEHPGGAYRVDVKVLGVGQRLVLGVEAQCIGGPGLLTEDLFSRWLLVDRMRIVPRDHPDREPYVVGSEHPSWA